MAGAHAHPTPKDYWILAVVLAVLTGRSASSFHLAPDRSLPRVPAAPASVPSDLLRRRPDLAAAERQLQGIAAA